jgi:hypothetical protein
MTSCCHLFACSEPGCRETWEVSYVGGDAKPDFWTIAKELARVRTELDLHEANCLEERYAESDRS